MDRELWARIKTLFEAAVAVPVDQREALLAELEPDPSVRARVAELLRADLDPEPALSGPADQLLSLMGSTLGPMEKSEGDTYEGRAPGEGIGPYRVVRRIGQGGMGTVYLAEHAQFAQRVALKVIKRGMDTDDVVRRFAAERQILARLEHAGVARLLGGGVTEDGLPWFSMEYVDGVPIDAYCRQRDLSLTARLALMESVCEAVQYAHANLVVHRDLKPTNILVTTDGSVRLLDFGIAKVVDAELDQTGLTSTGMRPMTPRYAAPEQIRGEPPTTATDVYALGAILYELITGEPPHGRELNTIERERAVLEQSPARPSARAPKRIGMRADLDNIVLMALRTDPARRYASAGALAEDLRRYVEGFPVRAAPDSVGYRARRFVARNRVGVVSATAVALVLLGSGAWYTVQIRTERDRAQLEAERFEAVAEYFNSIFTEATPQSDDVENPGLTVVDLIDWAIRNSDERLGAYPEAQARTLGNLAFVLRTRGDYERAEPALLKALGLAKVAAGGEVTDLLVQLNSNLGTMLAGMGRYEESATYFEEAVRLSRGYEEFNGYGVAYALNNLAKHLTRMGRYTEAATYLAEATAVYDELVGDRHEYRAIVLGNHARALLAAGRLEPVDSMLRRSMEDKWTAWPLGDLAIAEDQYTLSSLERLMGRADVALALADSALEFRERIPTENRSDVALSRQQRGLLLAERGDFDAGLADLRAGDSLFRIEAGPGHPLTFEGSMHLGMGLSLAGRAGAEALLLQSIDEADRFLPPAHPDRGAPRLELGLHYLRAGQPAQAEATLRAAVGLLEDGLPAGHWRTGRARAALGMALARLGATAEARSLLQASMGELEQALGRDHRFTAEAAGQLAALS